MSKFNELMEIFAPWAPEPIADGVYTDLSMADYHNSMAVGSSAIKIIQEDEAGPAMYYEKYLSEYRQPFSDGTDIGSIAHKMVLEQDDFDTTYVAGPEGVENKTYKDWKDFADAAKELGLIPIKHSEYKQVCDMRAELMKNSIARNMLAKGVAEHSYFATCKKTGVQIKARPDHVAPHPVIKGAFAGIDYKTTAIPSLGVNKWSSQEEKFCRQIQAAHHKNVFEQATGTKMPDFYHIAQMQQRPYLVRVFRVPPSWFADGAASFQIGKEILMRSLENASFDGYAEEIVDLRDLKNFNDDY